MLRSIAAAAIFAIFAVAPAASQAPTPTDVAAQAAAKDFAVFRSWIAGRWDNERQVFFQAELKPPKADESRRLHIEIAPLSGSGLGEDAFVLREKAEGGAGATLRTRILTLTPAAGGVAMRVHAPKAAVADEAKLDAASVDTAPCAILWRRREDQFAGALDCQRARKGPAQDLILAKDAFWLSDAVLDPPGAVDAMAAPQPGAFRLRRAEGFTCWTAVLRGARHGDSGEGARDWQFVRNQPIHDQGGELQITTDETPPRRFFLRLRAVEWPYGDNRPSLTLYVHEAGNSRALSYAWGEIDAERIGINLRWLQASCTRNPA
jgi:hypothetical protein